MLVVMITSPLSRLESQWEGLREADEVQADWLSDYEGASAYYTDYTFEADNPYLDEAGDLLAQG